MGRLLRHCTDGKERGRVRASWFGVLVASDGKSHHYTLPDLGSHSRVNQESEVSQKCIGRVDINKHIYVLESR